MEFGVLVGGEKIEIRGVGEEKRLKFMYRGVRCLPPAHFQMG